MSERAAYVLGTDDREIERLDEQAGSIAGATEALLRAAGIGGSMRVLDLGTGLGHVAFQVADLLDPGGSVLGVDQAERLLEVAERRRTAAGAENVGFLQADAREFSPSEPIGPVLCAGVTRSLAPQIVAHGIADEAELGLETLQERIAEQVGASDAVIMPPAVVGAWGTSRPPILEPGAPRCPT